jgi:glycosyltransferase involved in cell wall biosynthesis
MIVLFLIGLLAINGLEARDSKGVISVVSACYNEEGNLRNLYKRVHDTFEQSSYDFELIFVDNVSTDGSYDVFEALIKSDKRVRVVKMARNTGDPQYSYLAGLREAKGDGVVMIDADIQDPPEVILEFIKEWEAGSDVVYGVRRSRDEGVVLDFCMYWFYRIMSLFSYVDIPIDAGDFGLIDRRVADIMANIKEKSIYMRGMRAWVGFKQAPVLYDRVPRDRGVSTYSIVRYFRFAKTAMVNFADAPIEWISYLAILFVFLTLLLIVVCNLLWLFGYMSFSQTFLVILIMTVSTVQLGCMSVIGEYVLRTMHEVKDRPPYIVDKVIAQGNLK